MTFREGEWSRCCPSELGKLFRTADIDLSCYFHFNFYSSQHFLFHRKSRTSSADSEVWTLAPSKDSPSPFKKDKIAVHRRRIYRYRTLIRFSVAKSAMLILELNT